MMSALEPDALYRRCDPASLGFSTTNELEPLEHPAGQDRALEALEFGTGIAEPGYNIFVLGPRAAGKHTLVRRVLETRAADRSVPPDQCYIHNFERPGEPRLLTLPAGRGRQLQEDLEGLIEELFDTVPATFESEEYQGRLQDIQRSAQQQQEHAFQEVRDRAQEQEIALLQTPGGFTFAPMADGEVMDPEAFQKLDEATRERWQKKVESLQEELAKALRKIPQWRKEFGQRVRALNREMAEMTVGASLREIEDRYADCRAVGTHLAAIKHDITNNVDAFRSRDARDAQTDDNQASRPEAVHAVLNRYRVNVIVDNRDRSGAPVIYADLPGYQHLVGRAEHLARQGALFTDFTLLRAGALHQANGGYLILDARKLLMQPWAWEALKRALTAAEVRIESLERSLSLISTVSLEPEPMPLDLKVILIGDRELYYLLSAHDPDFNSLFKVQADFEDDLPRDETTARTYARLVASLARDAGTVAVGADGVARIIEQASRLAGDSGRMSAQAGHITDLLREAGYWARTDGAGIIDSGHVEKAIVQRESRADRVRDRLQRMIDRDLLLIDTEGATVGQINGLAVFQLDSFRFGRPSRITARVWLGRGRVLDIERETELGGAIHSKGVLILSGFLGARFGTERDLSLSASLAFEQSYGLVDGDSASVAELCALISALSGCPIRQSLAVTGSVNQHGRVQAIGGVNEKIEGFFDVCSRRGLTGNQGVIIPASNVPDLMLRRDVRDAAAAGRFHVYPVAHVDEALECLTGVPAGEADADGIFQADSVNRRAADRLHAFAERHRAQAAEGRDAS